MAAPRIIIATHNPGKKAEFLELVNGKVTALTLDDLPPTEEPVEDGATFQENADIKALDITRQLLEHGVDIKDAYIVADDSGLEVYALNNRPGIHTARYARVEERGPERDAANHQRLLRKLETALADVPEEERDGRRGAQLHTALSVALNGKIVARFEAICYGSIAGEERGQGGGHAYDCLFIPEGETRTFAEMGERERNALSMRTRAFSAFDTWLKVQTMKAKLPEFPALQPQRAPAPPTEAAEITPHAKEINR